MKNGVKDTYIHTSRDICSHNTKLAQLMVDRQAKILILAGQTDRLKCVNIA